MYQRNLLGQYIPQDSPAHSLQPHTKLLLTAGLAVALFFAGDGIELVMVTGALVLLAVLSRIPLRQYLESLKPMIILVFLIMIIQVVLSQAVSAGDIRVFAFDRQEWRQILFLGSKLLGVCWVAQWLMVTTSPVKIARGLELLLRPGARIGLPVQETAMMSTIALRFVPVILSEATDILKAQASRGADFESFKLRARMASLVSVLVPLLSRCWRRAEDLALSLEIRAYRAGRQKSYLQGTRLKQADYVFLIAVLLLLMLITVHGDGK